MSARIDAGNATKLDTFMSNLGQGASHVGEDLDWSLWMLGRALEITLILAVLGLLYTCRSVLFKVCLPWRLQGVFRPRNIKRCFLKLCCCFGWCSHGSLAHNFGVQGLADASQTLAVTLVGAHQLWKRMSFYVEAYTEPQEAASKASRTHQQVQDACDLGGERLELDWHGDEDELVIEIMDFPAPGKQKPLGEIRLQRETVEKYAREAAEVPGDERKGARSFSVPLMDEHIMKLRQKHLQYPEPTRVLDSFLLQKAQQKVGLGVGVDEDEVLRLRDENRQLRAQVTAMATGTKVTQLLDSKEEVMKLVLKFELMPRQNMQTLDLRKFAQPSFFEEGV